MASPDSSDCPLPEDPDLRATDGSTGRPTGPGPIGGDIASVVYGIGERLRIPALTSRYSSVAVIGLFAMVNGIFAIAVMAAAAALAHQPLVFPSLGPTAFLLFYAPTGDEASPRNAIIGHGIGASVGYLSLVLFGLTDLGPALIEGVTLSRVGAAALSLGLTSGLMVWLKVPHPPAAATTLIVSLGVLTSPRELMVLMVAVIVLVCQGYIINRVAGIDYPRWAPHGPPGRRRRQGSRFRS